MVGGDERQKIDGERTIRANPYHLHLLYGCNRHASMSTSPIFSGDTIGVQLCVEATLTEYATFEIQVPHLVTYPVMVGRAVRHGAAPRSEMGTSSVSGVGTMLPFQLATRERRTYRAQTSLPGPSFFGSGANRYHNAKKGRKILLFSNKKAAIWLKIGRFAKMDWQ